MASTPITREFTPPNVASGQWPGAFNLFVIGRNDALDPGDGFADVWEGGANLVPLAAAERMDIVSDSADDAQGGTGLTLAQITGVNDDGEYIGEVVALNGTTPVKTVLSYLRVNRLVGVSAGTGETNAGDLTATAETALTIQAHMEAGKGVAYSAYYTVPVNFTAFIERIEVGCAKLVGGGNPEISVAVQVREKASVPGAPWLTLFERELDTRASNNASFGSDFFLRLGEQAEIRVRIATNTTNSIVNYRLYGAVVSSNHLPPFARFVSSL